MIPSYIDAGTCPGGVVVRHYDINGGLIVERHLTDEAGLEALADADADIVNATTDQYISVGYDGDTGERMTGLLVVGDDAWDRLLRGLWNDDA
jgi:hypothetical protein